MNIKRNIIFSLENRKKNGMPVIENVPIQMHVIYSGQRIEFATDYRIDEAKWDTKLQRVKNNCTNKLKQTASEINSDLLKYYTDIQTVFKEFEVQGCVPTPEQIKAIFNERNKKNGSVEQIEDKKETIPFIGVFDEFIKECGIQNNWTISTYKKMSVVKNHLIAFDPMLSPGAFDESKLTGYVNYLREVKGMRNVTIGKQIGFLKWFLRWCIKIRYRQ